MDVEMAPPRLSPVRMILSFECNGHSNELSVTYTGSNLRQIAPLLLLAALSQGIVEVAQIVS
jgi:hypothetical protein